MIGALNRALGAALIVACLASQALAGTPRPLQVEDVTALEAFGRGGVSPDGRWAVYEKRGAYDAVPRFDFAQRSPWAAMDLWLVDLKAPQASPVPLTPGEGPGLLRGPWSPSGKRLVVFRFQAGRYEVGVVSMSDRSVFWTGLTPELPPAGSAVEWASDDRLVLMILPDGGLPRLMRYFTGSKSETVAAWAQTKDGSQASRTVIEAQDGIAVSERPEPAQALAVLDLDLNQRRILLEGRITDLSVSPDGRRVAVVEGGERTPIRSGAILQAEEARRQRLSIVDLDTGTIVAPEPAVDLAPHLLRWSADSRAVLVWGRRDGAEWNQSRLMSIAADGTTVFDQTGLTVGSGADILRGVRADWLGDAPLLYARPTAGGRFDWYRLEAGRKPSVVTGTFAVAPSQIAATGEGVLYMFGDGGFWAVQADGVRRMTPAGLTVRAAVSVDPEKTPRLRVNDAPRQDWAAASGPEGEILVLHADGSRRSLGRSGGRDFRWLAASPDAALLLDRVELVETLRLSKGRAPVDLDRVNAGLSDVVLARPVSVPHLDALGRATESRLFLPAGPPIKGLIVKVYPGSLDSGGWAGPLILTYGTRAEVLAGEGYAVLSPSMPIDRAGANTADFYRRSVDLAVDAALAAFPELPQGRIAIMGHSFGGTAALAIATRTNRYRTYVASSAITDLFGEWGEFDAATRILPEDGFLMRNQQGWVEAGQGEMDGPPWSKGQAYADFSPYLAADRISAPVLLITADKDYIPMSQSERMFSALYRRGGRVRLITYWGEHHAVWSPANIRDRYRQVLGWLEETLAPSSTTAEAAPPRPAPRPRTPPPP